MIAIISVLAAILFPVFAKAREKAREATCQSNLKQLGLAFTQYIQDYDETYPCNTSDPYLWQGQHFRWPIMPYLAIGQTQTAGAYTAKGGPDSAAILHCPSDTSTSYDNTSYAYSAAFYYTPMQDSQLTNVSYLYQTAPPGGQPTPQGDAQVVFPARKVLAGEWDDNHDGHLDGANGWWTTADVARVFLFADGHVKYLRASQMVIGVDGFADPNVTPGGIGGADVP